MDFVFHLEQHLHWITSHYQGWTYVLLFVVVFCETGLVVTPFLPGDSLLFLAGVLAHKGELNVLLLFGVFSAAALCGDNTNYFAGKFLGPRVFRNENSKLFKKSHLERTHAFFEKYGPKTIILARFVAIVRTFAPFVAGMGRMTYRRFIGYCVLGAFLWVGVCVFGGYFFARSKYVQEHFPIALVAVVAISVIPGALEFTKHYLQAKRSKAAAQAAASSLHSDGA